MAQTHNMYEAAFCKVRGFEIGKITYDKEQNLATINIEGDEEAIKRCLDDYYMNGTVDAKLFTEEIGFLKYTITKKARA